MSRSRRAPGRGADIARQMGLLVTPDGDSGTRDEAELEAELLALVGGPEEAPGKPPVPLEAIEEMAALCMRDPDQEEEEADEELEDEADLLAELREVLGDGAGSAAAPEPPPQPQVPAVAPEPDGLQSRLVERIGMYQAAAASARQAGDGSRLRRYERGLKTLQNMLEAVQSGKRIDEEDIPPPVALGKGLSPPQPPPVSPQPPPVSPQPPPVSPQPPPITPAHSPDAEPAPSPPPAPPGGAGAEAALRGRQQELKLAALEAKRRGDLEAAARSYRLAKGLDALIEAAAQGQPVEPGSVPLPPEPPPKEPPSPEPPQPPRSAPKAKPTPPAAATVPATPQDVLTALRQRMERYEAAAAQARSKGDDRKARMHDRIVKQYQSAIRAHGAGRAVDLSELPVPPGFQPLQDAAGPAAEQSLAHVLDAAAKLVSCNEEEEEEEEEGSGTEEAKLPALSPSAAAPSQPKPPNPPGATKPPPRPLAKGPGGRSPAAPPPRGPPAAPARQQLEFLGGRRRRLAQAALRAKRRNDLEGAKLLLRQAKGLDALIEAARGGLPVDISKVPEAPLDGEEFVLAARRGVALGPEAAARYLELMGRLRQQHELCVSSSRQFALLGNLAETTRWEHLAEECRQHGELLRGAHARGLPPPQHRYEQRTVGVLKSFPELSGSDLALSVVRGINLPAPAGLAPGDLDTFVRFEFPFPSVEEAQRDKTNVVRNTDCPEFRERFKLSLNRGHRGLRRVLHHKGIKFEVLHKGSLFKSDRLLGTAQLRLPALETVCELREILELLDGRRPTGGRLEVSVRLREPLGSPQLDTRTERWLVIVPAALVPKPTPGVAPSKDPNSSRTVPALPSLNLLAFDREKLERKMRAYAQAGRPVPPELREQHQELARRGQVLRTRLQRGDPPFRQEYLAQLERYLQLYTESARRLGTAGDREAAKEALYKRNLVESELQKFSR